MFEYLRGQLVVRDAAGLVIEVGGIGYRVRVSNRWNPAVSAGAQVKVYLHEHTSEQGTDLYGFETTEERNLFRTLLDVKGIGPRGALAVLSGTTREEFLRALATRDAKALTRIKGIGRKTAERILVELGDRLSKLQLEVGRPADLERDGGDPGETCVAALLALGVPRERAEEAVRAAIDRLGRPPLPADAESLVREALRGI